MLLYIHGCSVVHTYTLNFHKHIFIILTQNHYLHAHTNTHKQVYICTDIHIWTNTYTLEHIDKHYRSMFLFLVTTKQKLSLLYTHTKEQTQIINKQQEIIFKKIQIILQASTGSNI